MKTTRRDFLKTCAVAAGAALTGCSYPGGQDSGESFQTGRRNDNRPNILLVLVDQERWPYHTRPIRTPNRDRLKNNSVEFTNAHCTYPLCSPSRATILTGRYPHEAGILRNCDPMGGNRDMSPDIPTLGGVLSNAGYRTGYFGKWHLSGLTRSRSMPERYGFDDAYLSNQVVGIGSDEFIARKTGDWIKKQSGSSPWCAFYAPLNPHDICYPGLRHFYPHDGSDPGRQTELPRNYSRTRSPDIRLVRERTIDLGFRGPFDDDYYRCYIDFYCYLIEEVDRCLGILLDDLEESGQWDNTIVIYTSDHGEMAGSHGLLNKGVTMYKENMHIPLLISNPAAMNGCRRSNSLISHIDIVPTIMSLTGTGWPESLHGRSLISANGVPVSSTNDHIFAEGGVTVNAYWRGVQTDEWKYWHYTDSGEELLFNVKNDPNEVTNLAHDGGYARLVREFRSDVRSWRRSTNDPVITFLT